MRGGEREAQADRGGPVAGQGHAPGCSRKKALKPARKRQLVDGVRGDWKVSTRRACEALGIDRSLYVYKSKRGEQADLKHRIKEICETRVRYGYRRVHILLQRDGWPVNAKRIYRLYKELGLQLRNKTPKRRVKAKLREDRRPAVQINGKRRRGATLELAFSSGSWSGGLGDDLWRIGPRQQLVDAALQMTVDQFGDHVLDVGLRFDPAELAGRDQRRQDRPVFSAALRAREQAILARQRQRPDRAFDRVGVHLDATIVQEPGEALPVGQNVADRRGEIALLADRERCFAPPLRRVEREMREGSLGPSF